MGCKNYNQPKPHNLLNICQPSHIQLHPIHLYLFNTPHRLPVNTVVSELLQTDEPVTVSVNSVKHRSDELREETRNWGNWGRIVSARKLLSRELTWREVTWCDVMWCDVMWCDVMWCDVICVLVCACVCPWCQVPEKSPQRCVTNRCHQNAAEERYWMLVMNGWIVVNAGLSTSKVALHLFDGTTGWTPDW